MGSRVQLSDKTTTKVLVQKDNMYYVYFLYNIDWAQEMRKVRHFEKLISKAKESDFHDLFNNVYNFIPVTRLMKIIYSI